jgi:hypothetical protein
MLVLLLIALLYHWLRDFIFKFEISLNELCRHQVYFLIGAFLSLLERVDPPRLLKVIGDRVLGLAPPHERDKGQKLRHRLQNVLDCPAVLEGTLELRRAEDSEIVEGMKRLSLPPLSDPEFPDAIDAYEYLLKLRMDRVKASAVEEAENAVMQARMAYEILRDTTASALWLKDLEAFETGWNGMIKARERAASTTGSTPAPKKRTKQTD